MAALQAVLCLILFLQQVLYATSFSAVEWSAQTFSSSQCGVASSSDLTSAINTVVQMIAETIDYIPQSCLEVKNGSPESPSGYYTIQNDGSGVASVVYCDMDNLNTCPSLELTLTGLLSSYATLVTSVSGVQTGVDNLQTGVGNLQTGTNNLQSGVNNLQTGIGNLQTGTNNLQAGVDNLQTGVSSLQTGSDNVQTSVGNLQTGVDNVQTGLDNLETGYTCSTLELVNDATSCEDIQSKWPWATSGWYKISSEAVYCYMGDRCGVAGPWRRVLYLDMTDPSQTCPNNFRIYSADGVRTCGRPEGDGSCVESLSPTSSLSYSKVCGRIIGYQFGSPDGLQSGGIDDIYVDGVSVTRGNPRQHVWTLINQYNEDQHQCPCSGGSDLPAFIGDDYFCESGLIGDWSSVLYTGDPIWDGQQCGSEEASCCSLPTVPWFYKDLGSSTTDYIELRTCGNQHTGDEDTTIAIYEIYVQ